jgi:hydroxymethylglutaryl-CoA reductase (NADPH)
MVGRATFAACSWILDNYAGVKHFYLESNFATDKKASQINIMRTRGKRVTAEVTVPRDVLIQQMRVEPESLVYHHGVANVGAFLSGANNNGAHSANGITAMFIATAKTANVAEIVGSHLCRACPESRHVLPSPAPLSSPRTAGGPAFRRKASVSRCWAAVGRGGSTSSPRS